MVAPAQVDEMTHTASFRISLPLANVAPGRYTVQAVVVEAGGAQAAFGRSYFALRQPAAASTPAAAPAVAPAPTPAGGN